MNSNISDKIDRFFARYPKRTVDKGQILVFANEEPKYIYQLTKGRVKQYDISANGNEVIVNVFKPPAFFPMSWAINHTPNQYFFEAIVGVQYRQAPPEDVVKFLKTNPDVLFDLLARLYRGTDGLLGRLKHLMGGTAGSRLAYELLLENSRFGTERRGGSRFVPINESQLASYTGLSRETVNREMKKLVELGLVAVSRHGYLIKNVKKLEEQLGSGL